MTASTLQGLLLSWFALGLIALVAIGLARSRRPTADPARVAPLVRWTLAAAGFHVVHFAEEWATGLPRRLPALFGLEPWPDVYFFTVNGACLVAWLVVAAALTRAGGRHSAWLLAPVWFLGLASVFNAVAHPALAVAAGGYFPGLVTSPVSGLLGLVLLRALATATRPAGEAGRRP